VFAGSPPKLRGECWVASGFSRWGAPVPEGTELDEESVNPAKMKLRPVYHNPFASVQTSSKAVFLGQDLQQQQNWLDNETII